jgi:hypothetical protein
MARVCVTNGLLVISAGQEVLLFGRARGEGPICDQTSELQELRSSVAAYVRSKGPNRILLTRRSFEILGACGDHAIRRWIQLSIDWSVSCDRETAELRD